MILLVYVVYFKSGGSEVRELTTEDGRSGAGRSGELRISRIETHLAPDDSLAVVRVYTEDGLVGVGQTANKGAHLTVAVLHGLVAPVFLGESAWDLRVLVRECVRRRYKYSGALLCRALCGVDTALWDLLGKATGQPVYRLLGGRVRERVPVYASSMRRNISPEEEADRLLGLVEGLGFGGVKVRIGSRMGQDRDEWPGRTERLVPLVREVLGDAVEISADANGGFSAHRAIRVGRLLEEYGYHHFEEPCPFDEYENTRAVADALDVPVAGGEVETSLERFADMIRRRVVDIVQPDVGYFGGVTRTAQVAQMAEAAGLPCTPHCAYQSMQLVFNTHLAAALPSMYQRQELGIEPTHERPRWLYEPNLVVESGALKVPEGPGWGVEVVPEFFEQAETRASAAGDA